MTGGGRRSFFRELVRQGARTVAAFQEGLDLSRREKEVDDFFESYDSSYALTLAYPDDIILESARSAGIEVQGREKKDIVRELFEKHGGLY